ncbi:hypothetical protein N7492_000759 [Penicillium capsulatum]|uniref:Uncharacterized protein n=1 Tax=Penicillium capsulatum TaxID=69766 RepID=A0A9W9LZ25_9EURO|nr:hypothetical protein N7492_000759 [Penicillium capsulatum]KAJ6130181.1 hypothetical protein N7512_002961 [Penicillium capsulatum]
MSSGVPYLNKLRKPELTELAERTNLRDYDDYNKSELIAALDKHLSANQSSFAGDKKLADYYKRLNAGPRGGSPVKRESNVVLSPPSEKKSPTEKRSPGRPRATKQEPVESADETIKTPAPRRATVTSLQSPQSAVSRVELPQFPPSPAVVTDAIDRQTTRLREGLESAWTASGVLERSHALRASLSSVKAIEVIVILLEGISVLTELLPLRYLTTTPPVEAAHLPAISIKVPDLFVLLTGAFWAPFTLWLLTGLILPLVAAYFFNISWQAATGGQRRGRSASSQASFDPLTFNIAKALLVYNVYALHYSFRGLFSNFAIEKVNVSVPGQWAGMLTGNAIGVIGTLYEAILRH